MVHGLAELHLGHVDGPALSDRQVDGLLLEPLLAAEKELPLAGGEVLDLPLPLGVGLGLLERLVHPVHYGRDDDVAERLSLLVDNLSLGLRLSTILGRRHSAECQHTSQDDCHSSCGHHTHPRAATPAQMERLPNVQV